MTGSNPEFLRKFPLRPLSMRAWLCDNEVKTGWCTTSSAELVKDRCNGVLTGLTGVSTAHVPKTSLPPPRWVSQVLHSSATVLPGILHAPVSPGTAWPADGRSHGLGSPATSWPLVWHHFPLNGLSVSQSSSAVCGLTSKNCIWAPE